MNLNQTLTILASLTWGLFFLFVAVALYQNVRRQGLGFAVRRLFGTYTRIFIAVAVTLTIISNSLVFIEPQESGVVISLLMPRGFSDEPIESGLHFVVPFAERVVRYPISWQSYTMAARPMEGQVVGDDAITARTKDGQEVRLDCSVIFRIDVNQVVRLHINWQNRYTEEFVRPIIRGQVRSQVARYNVDEVNSTARTNLELDLAESLRQQFEDEGLLLGEFVLRNIEFSPEFALAVEQKQVALQQVQQREFEAQQIQILAGGRAEEIEIIANAQATAIVRKGQAEADARLLQAQSQSESLTLINQALGLNRDLLLYQYIDKIAPGIRVMLLPNDNPFLLQVPQSELLDGTPAEPATAVGTPVATPPATSPAGVAATPTAAPPPTTVVP
jgi:regulator of protease activity HflC (stomatin/prohibitin superfamily)